MKATAAAVILFAVAAASAGAAHRLTQVPAPPAAPLPKLGTQLSVFPAAPGADLARASCLACHSADMIRQQRLTPAQWSAEVDKMIRWGASVPDDTKAALTAYLAAQFGPDNDRFTPIATAPAGR